ncbi:MAG: hypothetical protein ACYCX3_00575 [Thermoleophilia bacterium]
MDWVSRSRFGVVGVGAALTMLFVMVLMGTALAATPQDIYNDFAQDGKLDGSYTQAELDAALTDPTLAQYGDPSVLDRLKTLIRSSGTDRTVFPFTGAEMLAILGGGVALVLLGLFLRRGRRDQTSV